MADTTGIARVSKTGDGYNTFANRLKGTKDAASLDSAITSIMTDFNANYNKSEPVSIMPTAEQAYETLSSASGEGEKPKGRHAMMAEMLNDAGYDAALIQTEPAYRSYELPGQDFDKKENPKELRKPIRLGE